MLDCKAMTTAMTTSLKLLNNNTSEAVDVTLYRQIIGSLMYLTNTRPDICFAVNTLSQYMVNPKHVHLIGAKHVMRYLKGTLDYGLRYTSSCMDMQIQIGVEVPNIGRVHRDAVSVWDLA